MSTRQESLFLVPTSPACENQSPSFGGGQRTGLPNSALNAFLSKSVCVVVHSHKCCTLLNTQWLLQFSTQDSRSFFWEAITRMPKGTGDQSASMTQIVPSSTLPVWSLSGLEAAFNAQTQERVCCESSARKWKKKWNQAPLAKHFKALLQTTVAVSGGWLIYCHYGVGSPTVDHHLRLARSVPALWWEENTNLVEKELTDKLLKPRFSQS